MTFKWVIGSHKMRPFKGNQLKWCRAAGSFACLLAWDSPSVHANTNTTDEKQYKLYRGKMWKIQVERFRFALFLSLLLSLPLSRSAWCPYLLKFSRSTSSPVSPFIVRTPSLTWTFCQAIFWRLYMTGLMMMNIKLENVTFNFSTYFMPVSFCWYFPSLRLCSNNIFEINALQFPSVTMEEHL